MALRGRLPDEQADYRDPVLGANLRAADEDLQPGEARFMKNLEFINGTVTRPGSSRLTATTLGAGTPIRGGHKFYYGTSSSQRLIAYGTKVSVLADNGTETVKSSTMTTNLDTFFKTWPVTGKVYVSNGTDKLFEYDGTTWQSTDSIVGATAVPNGCKMVSPILDRLLAVTSGGLIEQSNPRVAHIWSNNSSWATFRPQLSGPFTAIAQHTLRSVLGDLTPGVLACQANALYLITGTNFGADVTAVSAPTGVDAAIKLLDPRIGTSSPYSLCPVPGVGIFGVSSDLNVWFLPYGSASPQIIGDKIRSTGTTVGLESANLAAINQIWMQYFDRRVIIGFPTGSDVFCSTYFYLDMKSFLDHPDRGPVWYGPHTGFSVNRCWAEVQMSDNALLGGEGNGANGAFVYRLWQKGLYTDAVATVDTSIPYDYQTFFNPFGTPSQEKHVQAIQVDASCFTGTPTVTLYDVNTTLASGLTLTKI